MNIKEKFLELTTRTYPHGTEGDITALLFPELQKDEFGNLFIKIGESDVMFTAHLDTATSVLTNINHVIDGNLIKTDGLTILGADDKAGVTIMLYMIEHNIPGLYYFFVGEEVGCVGSKKVAGLHKIEKSNINKVISFDRKGTDSIITFQSSQRCCSDKFADELAKRLNEVEPSFSYKGDPTGLLTDSIQFTGIYPECTNISVGYKGEHTFTEYQNIEHLEKLAEACLKIDWSSLPIERDPSKTEYAKYSSYDYYGYGYDDDDWYYRKAYGYSNFSEPIKNSTTKVYFHDKKYNYNSSLEIDSITNKIISVNLSTDRISYEIMLIEDLLFNLDLEYDSFTWDGFKLTVNYKKVDDSCHISTCDRNDILEYLPELDYRNSDTICKNFVDNTVYSEFE